MEANMRVQRTEQKGRGRSASSPLAIPLRGWLDIAYRIYRSFNENHLLLTSAGVTFFMLFALVPSLSLFVTLYGMFNNPETVLDQLNLLNGVVPPGGLQILQDQLNRLATQSDHTLGITLVVSLLVAIWGAGAGIRALFQAMNVVYGETEKRNFLLINLLALAFIFGGLIIMSVMLTTVLIIPVVLAFLPFIGAWGWLVRIGAYAIMLLALFLALGVLYRFGPSRRDAKWHWISPGSIFGVLGITIVSVVFSWYAANFANYNATYGSLGALIGMLTWMWISLTIVILGGAVNSEIEHQTSADSTIGPDQPIGDRGAYVADSVGDRWPARQEREQEQASE